jgi:hypothetical protein
VQGHADRVIAEAVVFAAAMQQSLSGCLGDVRHVGEESFGLSPKDGRTSAWEPQLDRACSMRNIANVLLSCSGGEG